MPKNFYYLKSFDGGFVDAFNPRDIQDNELSVAQNVILDERKTIRTLGGDTSHEDITSSHAGHLAGGAGAACDGDGLVNPHSSPSLQSSSLQSSGWDGSIPSQNGLGTQVSKLVSRYR